MMVLFNWQKRINKALNNGTGPYRKTMACDLHAMLKLIQYVQTHQWKKAEKLYYSLEDMSLVPDTIAERILKNNANS